MVRGYCIKPKEELTLERVGGKKSRGGEKPFLYSIGGEGTKGNKHSLLKWKGWERKTTTTRGGKRGGETKRQGLLL